MTQQASGAENEIARVFGVQAVQQWKNKKSSAAERIEKLRRLQTVIGKYEADIAHALYVDLRKTKEVVQMEIGGVQGDIAHTIASLEQWMAPVEVATSPMFSHAKARISYEAKGQILLFGPWNFPFILTFQPLTAIVAAGNCAIVKMNEMGPAVSEVSARIIRETFDEADVAVFEGGVDVANRLLEYPFNHIFFTGSPAVGKVVMAAAARHLASVTLELGGKNPTIIDRGVDIAEAAAKVAIYRTMNSGQVCLCPENIWIPEELKDAFISVVAGIFSSRFYTEGKLNGEALGKLVDKRNFSRVAGYIEDARNKGANIVCGGQVDSEQQVIAPTILTDVPADARVLQEEIFGPILSIFTYKNIGEVYTALQCQPKPLALYIFSKSNGFVNDVLANTSSGSVCVNDCIMQVAETNLPFGGVNNSGIGSYHGIYGFRELSHARSMLSMP